MFLDYSLNSTVDPPKSLPIYYIYEASTPNIYENAERATNTNPGWLILTYVERTAAEKNAIRRAAGCGGVTDCSPESCEEYPPACTAEGGLGAFTACVPASEQNIQGGQIGSMVRWNNLKSGDKFLVILVPKPKIKIPETILVPQDDDVKERRRIKLPKAPKIPTIAKPVTVLGVLLLILWSLVPVGG
ncbi:MAG: NucA/NucB deoxyribonuclease domain-containing protein [Bacteroidia bacterium]